MPTKKEVRSILSACQTFAEKVGLTSGLTAKLDYLKLDFLSPPHDFLGASNNPAIFVNDYTYRLLGRFHPDWVANQTIALKESVLEKNPMQVIGIIAHEVGHAFNVAAKITNSEANAYLFEIEILLYWYHTRDPILADIEPADLMRYFESRLDLYNKGRIHNSSLAALVILISEETILDKSSAIEEEEEPISLDALTLPSVSLISTKTKPLQFSVRSFSNGSFFNSTLTLFSASEPLTKSRSDKEDTTLKLPLSLFDDRF